MWHRWRKSLALATVTVAVLATIGIPRSASAAVILGDATIEPSTDGDAVGSAEAFTVQASAGGAVTALNVYVDSSSSAQVLVTGIYSDNRGHPGTLLGQGSMTSPLAGAWNAVPISTATVVAGSTSWLAVLGAGGGSSLLFRDRCCGGGSASESSAQTNLTALPGTWSSGPRWQDGPVSVYAGASTPPPDPAQIGQFGPLMNWPLVAIHMAVLRNGNVLMMDGWQDPNLTQVFNPSTQTLTPATNGFGLDLFCVGHVNLADGRVLTIGGNSGATHSIGATTMFDPSSSTWTRLADMNIARWYPTATELGDGRVLAVSGQITVTSWADTPEIYDPTANTWTLLTRISTPQVHEMEYPLSFLVPSGKVFTIAPSVGQSFVLDPLAQTWIQTGGGTLMNGTAAQYLPGKILYSGGGTPLNSLNPAHQTAQVIDLNAATPAWQAVAPMNSPRYTHTMTVLPDGQVLAVGGSTVMDDTDPSKAVLSAEEWNPTSNTWTALAAMSVPRMYHSTAALVPDGRVLVAGGGHDETFLSAGNPDGQFFSPPYLFKGPRPTVTSAPTSATYGSSLTVATPDAASIGSVSLVSLAADTHTLDMDNHFVPLSFTAGSGTLTVAAPTSSNVAPPGYYMLFILNGSGVPSVASIVHIGPPVDTIPPTVSISAPAAGATVSGSAVTVSANAQDDVAVASVQFLLDGNPIGAPATQAPYAVTWDSRTVANGSHSLGARAYDLAGNVGTAPPVGVTVSNVAPLGVVVDVTLSAHGRGPLTVSGFNTSAAGDLLLAFVGSDGGTGAQTVSVTGAGLTWSLIKRSNGQAGDSEIWSARASSQLSGAAITATQSASGFDASLTVVAYKGAGGTGAAATASASSGAPSITLTTTHGQSLVYGVGNDYDNAIPRTLGGGQVLIDQWLDPSSGDTYWVQAIAGPVASSGSAATVNDTAPTGDRWNLAAVEVYPG